MRRRFDQNGIPQERANGTKITCEDIEDFHGNLKKMSMRK